MYKMFPSPNSKGSQYSKTCLVYKVCTQINWFTSTLAHRSVDFIGSTSANQEARRRFAPVTLTSLGYFYLYYFYLYFTFITVLGYFQLLQCASVCVCVCGDLELCATLKDSSTAQELYKSAALQFSTTQGQFPDTSPL